MAEELNVLILEEMPDRDALADAARLADVTLQSVQSEPASSSNGHIDLIIADESRAEEARNVLEEFGMAVPMLLLCNGTIGDRTSSLLRSGNADVAQHNDAAAIAAAMRRATARRSRIEDGDDADELRIYRTRLEELVRERTRELEESHQRLRLNDRMASMGTLATGIGHDIGNLVLPLRIGLESLESRELPTGCEPDLLAIRKSVEYLQGLANGLRFLAMDPDDVGIGASHNSLHDWWADVEPLLKNCLPREVAFIREFPSPSELPLIEMPLHHLTQIVFNLVQNAGDAMRGREAGTVRIRAEHAGGSDPDAPLVQLSVIDDGPGMTREVRERCMEPFFTTKFRGQSTGLGLPLVHGLIKRAGGEVELESKPGRGTRWTLILPGRPEREDLPRERRLVAKVDLADSRMSAYVTSVLRSLDFEVGDEGGGEAARTALCVTHADAPLGRAASTLLEEDDKLRIVLFSDSPNGGHPRLHAIGSNPSSSTIRAVLRELRNDFRL